jgi:hypothetical protein
MKMKIFTLAVFFISSHAYGAGCDSAKTDLGKAVDVPITGLMSCVTSNEDGYKIVSGKYSTGLTKRTGNHIPFKAFYKKNELIKIEFFNDPSDVVYGVDIK